MPEPRYRRRTARVILIDGRGRVLLFRSYRSAAEPALGYCWYTPGGGVDRREGLAQAAARELAEETGLRVTPAQLGEPVARAAGYADLGWARGLFEDTFFAYRTGEHQVDTSGFEALERSQINGHRWWPVGELTEPADPVYPLGLGPLVEDILAGRVPSPPRELAWHH